MQKEPRYFSTRTNASVGPLSSLTIESHELEHSLQDEEIDVDCSDEVVITIPNVPQMSRLLNSPKFGRVIDTGGSPGQGCAFSNTSNCRGLSLDTLIFKTMEQYDIPDENDPRSVESYQLQLPLENPFLRFQQDRKKPKEDICAYVTKIKQTHSQSRDVTARSRHQDNLAQILQAIKCIKTLPEPDPVQVMQKQARLHQLPQHSERKTLVLDLDETLVHCVDNIETEKPHMVVNVPLPSGGEVQAGVNIRPFLKDFLNYASANFELILFTASHQCYAEAVLRQIDPDGELFHHRLFRDSCVVVRGMHFKDLRVIPRDLKNMAIVDNSVQSFAYQLSNGIPILSWYDDLGDTELLKLMDYCHVLNNANDVRDVINASFSEEVLTDELVNEIVNS